MTTTTTQEPTMNDTARRAAKARRDRRNNYDAPPAAVITNTSAVASIDGDDLATIHASDMADVLGGYTRSVALVVDVTALYVIREALESMPGDQADLIQAAITATVDAGLR